MIKKIQYTHLKIKSIKTQNSLVFCYFYFLHHELIPEKNTNTSKNNLKPWKESKNLQNFQNPGKVRLSWGFWRIQERLYLIFMEGWGNGRFKTDFGKLRGDPSSKN